MKTLLIDTHSEKIYMAIVDNNKVTEIEKISKYSHSEIAMPILEKLLDSTNNKLPEMNQIVIVNGPGSFTGVRIGVTIAKTISYSLSIPIKTITSLEAYGISDKSKFDIITVEDTKGVYSAKYKNGKFEDFIYRKKLDFENYINEKGYIVSKNSTIHINSILNYIKGKEFVNPHLVNPIYIKEIDVKK